MKCEKCDKELAGGAVICRECGFNNALQRAWRLKQGAPAPPRQAAAGDATLIHFPVAPHAGAARAGGGGEEPGRPDWRTQVKERVRQSRERRGSDSPLGGSSREGSSLELDPRVRSAVSRIRRVASTTAAPAPRPVGHAARATARLIEYHEEAPPVVEPPVPPAVAPPVMPVVVPPVIPPVAAPEPPEPITRVSRVTAPLKPEPVMPAPGRPARPSPEPELHEALPKRAPFVAPEPPPEAMPEEEIRRLLEEDEAAQEEAPSWEESLGVEPPEVPQVSELPFPGPRRVPAFREPATLGERAIAGVLDFYVIATSYLPFFALFSLLDAQYSGGSLLLMGSAAAGLAFVYFFLMYLVAGRTGGMAWRKLRVSGPTGEPILMTRRRAIRRACGSLAALLLAPLNLVVILMNSERLGLADRLSDTIVVKQR
jgi:uncharacterized RDD family membrane protein YckC